MQPKHVVAMLLTLPILVGAGWGDSWLLARTPEPAQQGAQIVYIPEDVDAPPWVDARRAAQLATRDQFDVFHDFTFEDVQPASGITFLHRIVDDAGKYYKPVHYDHGNGIAVADVDQDGRLDVYLVNQAGSNRLYRNLGSGSFDDVTASAGVDGGEGIHVTASFADFDNDGDPDLYVTNVRAPNRLYRNNGDGSFSDISSGSGLDFNEHSSSAVVFDYDRDGWVDVFLTVVGQYTTDTVAPVTGTVDDELPPGPPVSYYVGFEADAFQGHMFPERFRRSRLFRNEGGETFRDVTEEVGLLEDGFNGAATPTDFNRDGYPDLYVLNMQGHDSYWVNQEGKRFVDQSEAVFPDTPWGAMGVKSFDYDNDGDMDMILTDMHSDMSVDVLVEEEKLKAEWLVDNWGEDFLRSEGHSIYGNAFYRNNGDGSFDEVSDQINTENFWPWGVSVGDLNADGWQDVFIAASMNFSFPYGINTVLVNNRGVRFMDAEYILGIEPRRDGETVKPWFRLACGGADRGHRDCVGRDGDVIIYGALGTRSSVVFDLDDDGDLDIITNEFGGHPQVLESNLSDRLGDALHFVKVRLRGTDSSRDALGARVTVTAGDNSWTQINDGQSGYLSQSSMPLYFGLGPATSVDRIDITWPSGQTSTVDDDLEINQVIEITEPAG